MSDWGESSHEADGVMSFEAEALVFNSLQARIMVSTPPKVIGELIRSRNEKSVYTEW